MAVKNATIGEGAIIEPNVTVGFQYHESAGPAVIGRKCTLRRGTIIYADVQIGDFFETAHYVVVRAMVKIGDYCTILNHSTLEGIVRMGDGVRIMSHVYIPSRTWFGNDVFVGPGVTFLNERYPGRRERPTTPRGATVEDDVMIGGGCTILPGVTIGERSFIAAGAVVNRDVPSHSFVAGIPGRIRPLPEHLDRPNSRRLTRKQHGIWHSANDYEGAKTWPEDWPDRWQ
jgi:acetyltransferase-like isoleucine patch superfamily enzyme